MSEVSDTELLDYFDRAYMLQTADEQGVKHVHGMTFRLTLTISLLGHEVQGSSLRECLTKIRVASIPEIMALDLQKF